jgi:hypothetical protein
VVAVAPEVLVLDDFGAVYPLQSAIEYSARHVVWLCQSFLAWLSSAVWALVDAED